MPFRVGIDVGGTFTDLLLLNESDGSTSLFKIPSTPHDPAEGVLNGLRTLLRESGIPSTDVERVMHSTTVATNAVLEGRGAKVGLLCTEGFEQVLRPLPRLQLRTEKHDRRRDGNLPGPAHGIAIHLRRSTDPPGVVNDVANQNDALSRQPERLHVFDSP